MDKELTEMSLEELWKLFPIVLKKYNEAYIDWYKEEKEKLTNLIGEHQIIRINHIGSSAVKKLISKPTVDILLEINNKSDINKINTKILDQGWILMSSEHKPYLNWSYNKGYTKKGYAEKVYHLHIRFAGDWDELYFRDYLMDCKEIADEYSLLKKKLATQYKYNRDGYTNAKSEFIVKHTTDARKKYGSRYSI